MSTQPKFTYEEAQATAREFGAPEEIIDNPLLMKYWLDGYQKGHETATALALAHFQKLIPDES